ncbi:MAG: thiamine biosynthesis protein ThiJ [Labilithrix sp.]|nr:thiamine biosynthesis protein ThiJ [Labilithrix sp.]
MLTLMTTHVGMLLFPNLTQLDLTGPFEMFNRLPDVAVHLAWKTMDVVRSDTNLGLMPTTTLEACPPLDVLFVPGGAGQMDVMGDEGVLRFVRERGEKARWVTSVCTGALILGAAGLLRDHDATTHWAFRELLPMFGARLAPGRVVVDRNRMTAGGVTAGIDFGLRIIAEIAGERRAKEAQLELEYDPSPPYRCGHPDVADQDVVDAVRARFEARFATRAAQLSAWASTGDAT